MRTRLTLAALALTLAVGACDREAPTASNATPDNQTPSTQLQQQRQPLIFPVNPVQVFTSTTGVVYTVASVKVTRFDYDQATRTLLVSGDLRDASGAVIGSFSRVPSTLTSSGAPTAATCQILNLDIGAIHLDLLGLVVDLAPIHLDITAQSGPGKLLGNLLCALTHLLDGGPFAAIQNLINQINAILAGL